LRAHMSGSRTHTHTIIAVDGFGGLSVRSAVEDTIVPFVHGIGGHCSCESRTDVCFVLYTPEGVRIPESEQPSISHIYRNLLLWKTQVASSYEVVNLTI